ncbi:hypothetical protein T265_05543 [Opisthorchis viverrini]|uniref:Uncharacterized protein n=1 Tax=Opisthorchis viverrini TaxID=6198 RepID=A0A074ZJD0_OPIVI|nr:hypothetical protein T265_05543 [Opisthorchis viverrini]KER27443.1 hypothetical protein T265_05543 [Opisthorchis viverrini]
MTARGLLEEVYPPEGYLVSELFKNYQDTRSCRFSGVWIFIMGEMAKRLEHQFTDRKVCGLKPNSGSRIPLSRLGQPGSIPAPVKPPGGMATSPDSLGHLSSCYCAFTNSNRVAKEITSSQPYGDLLSCRSEPHKLAFTSKTTTKGAQGILTFKTKSVTLLQRFIYIA